VALFLVHLEKECVILDDVFVVNTLYISEVALQKKNMFPVQPHRFDCIQLVAIFMIAFLYHSVCTLTNFLPYHVLLQHNRGLLRRHILAFRIGSDFLLAIVYVSMKEVELLSLGQFKCGVAKNGHFG
jgi:hypothetical protein